MWFVTSYWWYALAAWLEDKVQLCLFIGNTLDGYPPE